MEFRITLSDQEQKLLGLDQAEYCEADAILLSLGVEQALNRNTQRQDDLRCDDEAGISGAVRDAQQQARMEQIVLADMGGKLGHFLGLDGAVLPPQVQR